MKARARVLGVVSVLLLLLPACQAGRDSSEAAGECSGTQEFKIGLIGGVTGVVAETVARGFNAAKLAIDQRNAEGPITVGCQNYELVYVEGDDKNDTAEATNVMRRLVQVEEVDVVVGSYTSVVALVQMDVAEQFEVPFIIVGASTSEIPKTIEEQGYQYTFMSSPVAPERGKAESLALMELLAPESVFMVHQDTGFGHDVTGALIQGFEDSGLQVESEKEVVDPGTTNYGPAVAKILDRRPDLVYAALSGPEMYSFIEQFRGRDTTTPIFASGSDFPSSDFMSTLGPTAEGIIGNLAWVPTEGNPLVEQFAADFEAEYGRTPADVEAQTYDGMQMLFAALANAESTSPDDIAASLLETEVEGVRGLNDYEESDHSTRDLTFIIGQVRDGEHVLIWPEEVKTGDYLAP